MTCARHLRSRIRLPFCSRKALHTVGQAAGKQVGQLLQLLGFNVSRGSCVSGWLSLLQELSNFRKLCRQWEGFLWA